MKWGLLLGGCLLLAAMPLLFGTSFLASPGESLSLAPVQGDALSQAKKATLRVRNISCRGAELGTAVAIDSQTLITNKHVVEGAQVLEVDTWDGQTVQVPVRGISLAESADVALVRINGILPAEARFAGDPGEGQEVFAVGYPGGGRLQISPGKVVRYISGSTLGQVGYKGSVMVVSSAIRPGNSGGPLVNKDGKVVGVVFAVDYYKDYKKGQRLGNGYVIPFSEIERLLRSGSEKKFLQRPCQPVKSISANPLG